MYSSSIDDEWDKFISVSNNDETDDVDVEDEELINNANTIYLNDQLIAPKSIEEIYILV